MFDRWVRPVGPVAVGLLWLCFEATCSWWKEFPAVMQALSCMVASCLIDQRSSVASKLLKMLSYRPKIGVSKVWHRSYIGFTSGQRQWWFWFLLKACSQEPVGRAVILRRCIRRNSLSLSLSLYRCCYARMIPLLKSSRRLGVTVSLRLCC